MQAAQAVAVVVDGVVPRQESPRLGEEDDHQAHDHAAGGAVDVGLVDRRALSCQGFAVALDQTFDRLAHPFAECLGEFGLALAAVADRTEQGRVGAFSLGCPERRLDQREQRVQGVRGSPLGEPEVCVPLAPGVEVEAREEEPPLAAVREQGEPFVAGAQPAEGAARFAPAAADPDLLVTSNEDGEDRSLRAQPEVARADALAGQGPAAPLSGDAAAAQPAGARVARFEAAQALQHERDELRSSAGAGGAGVAERVGQSAGLALQPGVEDARLRENGDLALALRVEQQAAMAQVVPAREAQGSRTSMATGNACAFPASAWRFGRSRSTIRRRSRSNWSRASS